MRFIADLHIHSHFSRATSKLLVPEYLDYWAGIKGIQVVGTGDFTHPGWLAELKEKLEPEGNGLFRLKKAFRMDPLAEENPTRFVLTAEISNIYKRGDKVRKVHNVIMAPGFDDVEKINGRILDLGGNLTSDGRPILGLDSYDLLALVLESNEKNVFIPAHIWTPWFSMLGSKSGFDSPQECFGDLWPYIHSVETGLSTDAPMNWLCSFLDRVTLISNSDAHSPDRLGRNANIFDTGLNFSEIAGALQSGSPDLFKGTIDLFPQEGKYHYDGHRKCSVCWDPGTTIKNNSVCPVCGKPVTIGVMNRIIHLSDREDITNRKNRLPFYSIIPLREILAEIKGAGEKSKAVQMEYEKTIRKLGNELDILLHKPLEEIEKKSSVLFAEAIRRMRNREVVVKEGYDGEYGQVKVFNPGEMENLTAGNGLFIFEKPAPPSPRKLIDFDLSGIQQRIKQDQEMPEVAEKKEHYEKRLKEALNPEQQAAVEFTGRVSIILAGPGTGKTKTLTAKISFLLDNNRIDPRQVLAITFTNKAASEMRSRIRAEAEGKNTMPVVLTFHGFGRLVLEENAVRLNRKPGFILMDENEKIEILKSLTGRNPAQIKKTSTEISGAKQGETRQANEEDKEIYTQYEKLLQEYNAFDFDDLIAKPLELFRNDKEVLKKYRDRFPFVFVDEFQDTNPEQFELIRLLAGGEKSMLCVVGDPNQAIYSFRGGGSRMIDRFIKEFPRAERFKLKTSYRCTQNILSASSDILNGSGWLKGLKKGIKIQISEQATDKSEAECIAREIVNLSGGLSFFSIDSEVYQGDREEKVKSLSEIAVLCRTRHQFQPIEKAFKDHTIPYQVVGDKPFFQSLPLSDLLAIYHACLLPQTNRYATWLSENRGVHFKEKAKAVCSKIENLNVQKGLELVRKEFFEDREFDEQDFRRLQGMAGRMSPMDFITSLKLGSAADTYNDKLEAVTLMTLHASKGLEFESVFIAGCEQGLIPFTLYNMKTDRDEEARLLYVGMTRSEKFLYLSYARSRKFRNRIVTLQRSELIHKIEKEWVEEKFYQSGMKKDDGHQLNLFNKTTMTNHTKNKNDKYGSSMSHL